MLLSIIVQTAQGDNLFVIARDSVPLAACQSAAQDFADTAFLETAQDYVKGPRSAPPNHVEGYKMLNDLYQVHYKLCHSDVYVLVLCQLQDNAFVGQQALADTLTVLSRHTKDQITTKALCGLGKAYAHVYAELEELLYGQQQAAGQAEQQQGHGQQQVLAPGWEDIMNGANESKLMSQSAYGLSFAMPTFEAAFEEENEVDMASNAISFNTPMSGLSSSVSEDVLNNLTSLEGEPSFSLEETTASLTPVLSVVDTPEMESPVDTHLDTGKVAEGTADGPEEDGTQHERSSSTSEEPLELEVAVADSTKEQVEEDKETETVSTSTTEGSAGGAGGALEAVFIVKENLATEHKEGKVSSNTVMGDLFMQVTAGLQDKEDKEEVEMVVRVEASVEGSVGSSSSSSAHCIKKALLRANNAAVRKMEQSSGGWVLNVHTSAGEARAGVVLLKYKVSECGVEPLRVVAKWKMGQGSASVMVQYMPHGRVVTQDLEDMQVLVPVHGQATGKNKSAPRIKWTSKTSAMWEVDRVPAGAKAQVLQALFELTQPGKADCIKTRYNAPGLSCLAPVITLQNGVQAQVQQSLKVLLQTHPPSSTEASAASESSSSSSSSSS